jgi:hypothetical protein
VFSYLIWRVLSVRIAVWDWCYWCLCLHVFYAVMCIVLLSAGVVWNCVNVLYGDYIWYRIRILEIKQYFVHLFILLVRAINMEFFKAIHSSVF